MLNPKDSISRVAILIVREGWSHDRIAHAIRAVAAPRSHPRDPLRAVADYEQTMAAGTREPVKATRSTEGRVVVRVRRKKRRVRRD